MNTTSTSDSLSPEHESIRLMWANYCAAMSRALPAEADRTGGTQDRAWLVVEGARLKMAEAARR